MGVEPARMGEARLHAGRIKQLRRLRDGNHRRDPRNRHVRLGHAHERHAGDPSALARRSHARDHLAMARLRIQPALARYAEACPPQAATKRHQIEHAVYAALCAGAQKRHTGETQAAGGPGPRGTGIHAHAERGAEHLGIARHPPFELLDLLRRRPLLRGEDACGTKLAYQGVIDIAHHGEVGARDVAAQQADIDGPHMGKVGAAAHELAAVLVQKACAQRAHAAHAAVVGGRAAHRKGDVRASLHQGVRDELARPVGRRAQGIALVRAKQRQARCRGHLDDGTTGSQKAVARLHGTPQRVMHAHRAHLAAHGRHDGVHRPLAAIGHGHARARGVGEVGMRRRLEESFRLSGGQRPLEGVGGKDKVELRGQVIHGASLSRGCFPPMIGRSHGQDRPRRCA
ncbi:hypothetical protein HMPREF1316_1258 [Olsenella profusa F0195]|uniref:Uncharacterized protein n=1 Tax=Olsenella profusa F0195 TaxID=1125712 RepID=U2UT84_9ACTN|nr:hypothetical protein HMPREF1316_1258 [Olsenella profusa F0195]